MKEAIGGGWLFTLVIVLISLFSAFVAISTNYSRCYKIKDEILAIVERNKGVNMSTIPEINSYLGGLNYRSVGACPDDCTSGSPWYGFSITNDRGPTTSTKKVNYCIKKMDVVKYKSDGTSTGPVGHPDTAYYEVLVFFHLDLPMFNEMFQIRVEGQTSLIVNAKDDLPPRSC